MKENFLKNVSARLRELRANRQLSLAKVSKNSGVSIDMISRYENNKTSIQVDVLAKILSVYNISMSNFFEEIHAKTQKNESEE